MVCPVGNEPIPKDCDIIEKNHNVVILQGYVYEVIDPKDAYYPPYSDYLTVSLYPRKGRVKYLKFKTRKELDKWSFEMEEDYTVEGCLHLAGGKFLTKELVFDVIRVERRD